MPRNVRNFWIEADIDGRRSPFASGPVRKDGGFELNISQRDEGGIVRALRVAGTADADGELTLTIVPMRPADFAMFAQDGRITISTRR